MKKRAIIIRDDMRENKIVISGFMHVIRLPKNSSANKLNSTRNNFHKLEFNFLGADEFNLSL